MNPPPRNYHRLVRTYYQVRTAAFAALCVAMGMHMQGQGYGTIAWMLLGLQFLGYPHLIFLRARAAANSLQAERTNLKLDSLLLGVWSAALGFPLWIAYTLFLGTTLNNAINTGARGALAGLLAYLAGALAWIAVAGFRFAPDTAFPVTVLCIVGLSAYVVGLGALTYLRNRTLRRTREVLQRSEEQFRTLAEQLPLGLVLIAGDGRYDFISPSFTALTGYGAADVPDGRTWFSRAYPDAPYRRRVIAQWKEDLRSAGEGVPRPREYPVICKDGSRKLILFRPVIMTAARQCVLYEDVTERRRAEQIEARYRAAFFTSPDAVNIVRLSDGLCIESNAGFTEITGWARDEVIGRTMADIKVWFDPAERKRLMESVRRDSHCRSMEFRFVKKDGTVRWGLISASLLDVDGEQCVLSVSRDIDERKRMEDRLRTLSLAVEQSPVSIVITDPGGSIEYVNPRFEAVSGYARGEVTGQNPRILKSGMISSSTYEGLWATITAGREWHGELCNRRKNGELYWELASISPLLDENGRIAHFIGVKEDITERKQAEQAIRELNEGLERRVGERTVELEQSNKEMESFSYSISHDLRTPVRALLGYSEILLREHREGLDEQGARLLGRIAENSRRMADMIDDLLRLSRVGRDSLNRERVDLDAVTREVVAAHAGDFPRTAVAIAALPPADCDRGLIRQVLDNLIGNALKYSGKAASPRVEVGAETQGSDTVYFVRDNGIGFDMAYAGKLFGIFHRLTPAEFPGTGVGLVIVKRIIERHGGRVWADARPGEGATFRFTLG